MKHQRLSPRILITLLVVGLLLASCRSGAQEVTPTLSVDQVQTLAIGTFSAGLTSTANAFPTDSPTPTVTPTVEAISTIAPTSTSVAVQPNPGVIPTPSCYGLTFVSDVTIPDNTTMTPGNTFTKTWRVKNSGSCAWKTGFSLRFTGGEAMGGSSVALKDGVDPGKEIELSVDLTAPSTNGTYRGNWRMTTASGAYFGDEVYVLIVVGGSTPTATPKSSATSGPTATATASATSGPTATASLTPSESPTSTDTVGP